MTGSLKPKLAVLLQTSTSIARNESIVWLGVDVSGGQNLDATTVYWQLHGDVHSNPLVAGPNLAQVSILSRRRSLLLGLKLGVRAVAPSPHRLWWW